MTPPSLRARCVRFLIRHYVGRMYQRVGPSVSGLRKLDTMLIRSQRPPRGTVVEPVKLNGISGELIRGSEAIADEAILYLHGGAFITGSPATHRELAARISASTGVEVLSPDYRLSPEHPFPAAVEDVHEAYLWLLDRGYSPSRLALGGESSGGGLALQTLLYLKANGVPLPAAAFFLSPVTDWIRLDGESYHTRAALDPLLSPSQCRFTASLYIGGHAKDSGLLDPTKMDLAGLPPLWIQVGDHEILRSDAERLAERASEAGVDVHFKVWPGLWHVFQATARLVPEARESIEQLARFLKGHLGSRSTGEASLEGRRPW